MRFFFFKKILVNSRFGPLLWKVGHQPFPSQHHLFSSYPDCVIDLVSLLFALCLCGYVNMYGYSGVYAHVGVDAEDWCLLSSSISLHLIL